MENKFHKCFKLQGKSFSSVNELINFSETISIEANNFFKNWFNEKQFIEVKTSGSTGTPKLIQLQKKHMINSAKATGDFFELTENTTALLCMSPNYIAGKMMLVRALTLGWDLDIVEPISNPLENIKKVYDFSAMVPLQLAKSIIDIHKVKKLIVGGGVVSKELLHQIQHIKTEVFATYGMTETVTHIAVKQLNSFKNVIASKTNQSHYKTLPNIKISTDKRGCLVIDAPKVSDVQIITNDLVELVSETEFNWLGRFDAIINSGGIKLIPEQLEDKLATIIKEPFFLAGLPDVVLGEKMILVIENSETKSSRSTLISTSLNHQKNNVFQKINDLKTLSKYEIPKEIYFVESFIKTPTDKINRNETLKLLEK